ncbi:MAG: hypothetical protein B6241_10090 [Spirochaetaceae bacterium 4572_59]|nr:MAG: hypothetical protein B6241_10090 [Spirochaetaceae bacterium 4572_59]
MIGNSKNHLFSINHSPFFRVIVFFANLIVVVFWRPLFVIFSGFRIHGKKILKQTPKGIIIANHCLNLDAYFIGSTSWPRTTWYAVEANNILRKDVGWHHRINGAFGIYDTYPMSIASSVKKSMTRNEFVTIFPEGKMTNRGQTIGPFSKGAFYLALKNEVPLIPVVIVLYGRKFFRLSPWVSCRVHMHVLPPIETKGLLKPGESIKQKSAELAEFVHKIMQDCIDENGGEKDLETDRIFK